MIAVESRRFKKQSRCTVQIDRLTQAFVEVQNKSAALHIGYEPKAQLQALGPNPRAMAASRARSEPRIRSGDHEGDEHMDANPFLSQRARLEFLRN